MKKKLEAELISIAHRILKLKNKSDLIQLHQEAQKLYEKLSVLKFVEENFADAKPTIGYKEIEDKLDAVFDSENSAAAEENPKSETEKVEVVEEQASESEVENNEDALTETETPEETASETEKEETLEATEGTEILEAESEEQAEAIPAASESSEENVAETENSETSESPSEEAQTEEKPQPEQTPEPFAHLTQEEVAEETLAAAEPVIETSKEEQTGESQKSDNSSFKPSFELAFDPKEDPDTDKFNSPAQTSLEDFLHDNYVDPVFVTPEDLQKEKEEKEKEKAAQSYTSYQSSAETPAKSLNDRMAKGIIIGLNDRIAFMNHLFNNSSEDYNRVLSQLMTIDNFREAKNFIDTMVKPDYNNWAGKEEYEQRFMEIVEKKFS
ncbi:hypothetical protein FNO01nite_04150 [Flavobacterium noncentrifugens]|uniref:Uncharacterized protein n=1 Tax=Flavobacterium noncentrifugens TaxID=1128970 RepID=A0A1G8SB36_9FLAO|nr:hypothetical protein [Flavobacterium noncentrifugens]GEP49743.1 hypothetical protein FNO01nite_04150 [Flavobacterium noncentrifugens]SDJ25860.1 hypothetical protein SAMN04487935_0462 [Flavobacterium noncentrifugens]